MGVKLNWPKKYLGDIAEFRNGINFNKNNFGEGMKIIGVADFQDLIKPRYSELDQVNPIGIVKEKDILKDKDIVFVRSNGNRELIGRSLYIDKPPANITHSAFTIRLRFIEQRVSSRFFAYLFRTKMVRDALTAYGSGTNISNLNQNILRTLEVPFPSYDLQCRIATILSNYDDLIENNLRRIKILEEIAQNLYREWFVNFRFPDHENARFVDSPLGKIPEGWKCGLINDLFELYGGYPFKSKDFAKSAKYAIVTIKNVKDGVFIDKFDSQVAELPSNMSKHCILSTGDILISLTGNVGRTCLAFGDNYLLNQRVAKIVPRIKNNLGFVYLMCRQKDFQKMLENISSGVAQQNLSPIKMGNMEVVIPTEVMLKAFASYTENIIELILKLYLQNKALNQIRDLLLPKLISGEVDVSDLDITLPEEVLA